MATAEDMRKDTVSFKKDIVFGGELDQFFVHMVVVGVELNLLQVRPACLHSGEKVHTWFTAGVTVATFNISRM